MTSKKIRKAEKQDGKQRKARKPRKEGHSRDYERKRRDEGKRYKKRMRHLRRVLREFGKEAGIGDLVALVYVLLARAWHNMSYRSHVTYLQIRPGEMRMCGFKRPPSKSTLHRMAGRVAGMGAGALHAIVIGMALLCLPGRRGRTKTDLCCDSTGYSLKVTVPWRTAKYGDRSQKDYCKFHTISTIGGIILAFEATGAHAHDSPWFRTMLERIPHGSGIVVLDAAYDANLNYEAIVRSGRTPYINQRKGSEPRGFGERAKAMRRYRDDPDDFAEQYGKRNSAEALFSSMKERMGAGLRSKTLRMQTVNLFARVLCHNLTA